MDILPQPNESTCGPTCLHAIYQHYGDVLELPELIAEVQSLEHGGTLAVFLACHALRRGYRATLYTYNLQIFDPTWFDRPGVDIAERLRSQLPHKDTPQFRQATEGYLEYLSLGGKLRYSELKPNLLRSYLKRNIPILTGLSATYLYGTARERGAACIYDDLRGEPAGHFVVLHDYERDKRIVHIADPLYPNPIAVGQHYAASLNRVLGAILLGVLTQDANLLMLEPAT